MVNRPARHAADGMSLYGIATGALVVIVAIAFSMIVAFALIHGETRELRAAAPRNAPAIAGAVTLQPTPEKDIAAYRAEKQRLLNEYAWIDRDRGIVRIPIEQAMAMLARTGARR